MAPFLAGMEFKGRGQVAIIGSIAGHGAATAGSAPYAASKSAVRILAQGKSDSHTLNPTPPTRA